MSLTGFLPRTQSKHQVCARVALALIRRVTLTVTFGCLSPQFLHAVPLSIPLFSMLLKMGYADYPLINGYNFEEMGH
jgi:hypothetical protein